MPKMKTNRGAAKRFKVTATGRIKRGKAFNRHNLTKTSHSRKGQLVGTGMVAEADEKRIKRLLPYG